MLILMDTVHDTKQVELFTRFGVCKYYIKLKIFLYKIRI